MKRSTHRNKEHKHLIFINLLTKLNMKRTALAMAAATLTLGFASCSKETGQSGGSESGGKATAMTVSLSLPNNNTRATGDPNGTDNEAKVTNVDVFIYTASGAFSSAAHLTASDFTQGPSTSDADTYIASTSIPTTTGTKTVFVGINLPASVVTTLKSNSESAVYWLAQTMSRTDLTGAANDNFAMFSVAPMSSTFVENPAADANNLNIQCKRLVAKVTVETDAALQKSGVPGILGDFKFAINNFNTKLFMIQSPAPNIEDPNWASGSYISDDFTDTTTYLPILERASFVGTPAAADYSPGYAAENTSEGKLRKELTRATVCATFIPLSITKFDGVGGYVTNDDYGNVTVPQTFYTVTPSIEEGTSYFFDAAAAIAFSTEKSAPLITYNGGLCYWNIYLNKTPKNDVNRWDVLRNDWYQCNITRINAPGRPTPDVSYPELPPDVDTDIKVDIDILYWNTPILSNYVLE